MVRHRKLSFGYVLFEHKSRFYEYSMLGSVEATSKDTVKFIEDVVCSRIDIPSSERKVGVCVYEVWYPNVTFWHEAHGPQPKEAFQAAYNKDVHDLTTLELTDENLDSKIATKLPSSHKLSDVRTGQTLIVTFCMFVSTGQSREPLTSAQAWRRVRLLRVSGIHARLDSVFSYLRNSSGKNCRTGPWTATPFQSSEVFESTDHSES